MYQYEATLTPDQWDQPPPECPQCQAHLMGQVFTPPHINGSNYAKASAMAEKIAAEDYGVSNITRDHRMESTPKVAYRDDMMGQPIGKGRDWVSDTQSTWGTSSAAFQQAAANGRRMRRQFGDGLDVLKSTLASGAQPDLLAASKRRAMRVY